MKPCDIYQATHVEDKNGKVHRIMEKWGVDDRHLAKPSEGGFGCVTEGGERISMWDAHAYYREEQHPKPFMSMWTVYDHPFDFPDKFVARRIDLFHGGESRPSREHYFIADTLDAIRELIPAGLVCMTRFEEDDPKIVEVWL